jgi:HAD superfamily hydrolase (TIGR01509 family)
MMIKAILLDFNGVVIDDEPIQLAAYRDMFKAEGIEISDDEYYSRLGMDDRTFVTSVFEAVDVKPDENKILEMTQGKTQRWHDAVASSVPLFDGVENFVRKMSKEFALGIVSMTNRQEIDFVLEKTGLSECFSVIVSAEDVENCKPDPECYRTGFRLLDLERIARGHLPMVHSECLVIEDSPPGVQAAKGADLPVLGVVNTVTADALRAAGADSIALRLDDWMPDSVRRVFA